MLPVVVAMRVQSVRFGPDQWELISEAARVTKTPIGQFVRESAFARAVAVVLIDQMGHSERDEPDPGAFKMRLTAALTRHPDLLDQLVLALGNTLPTVERPAPTSRGGRRKAKPPGTRRSARKT